MMDRMTFKRMLMPYLEGISSSGGQVKVGSFTRDMTASSGSVSYTGVGFQPKCVVFVSAIDTTSMSVGFDDGTSHYCVRGVSYGGTVLFNRVGSNSIDIATSFVDQQQGKGTSLDSDGFTITWTKGGSPTGTGYVYYLAFG